MNQINVVLNIVFANDISIASSRLILVSHLFVGAAIFNDFYFIATFSIRRLFFFLGTPLVLFVSTFIFYLLLLVVLAILKVLVLMHIEDLLSLLWSQTLLIQIDDLLKSLRRQIASISNQSRV